MDLFEYIEFKVGVRNTVNNIETYGEAVKDILVAIVTAAKEIKEAVKEA